MHPSDTAYFVPHMPQTILIDVPEQIETPRLLLRRPRNGDGEAIHCAVVESLPDLRQWGASVPWAMLEPSVDASESFCREAQANFIRRTSLVYLFFSNQSGELVGSSSLHNINWTVPKFEIGYWCRSSQHRQGYTTEVVAALASLAFDALGARRVQCITDELNRASRRVCERAGMTLEATLHNERLGVQSELRNTCIYARTQ